MFLAAVITNGVAAITRVFSGKKRKPKLIVPEDFINKNFKNIINRILGEDNNDIPEKGKFERHTNDAKQKGLRGPW